ncbi:capsid cement protein [Mycolicibacterium wolinskyi]|uniref:capsid cement protein n=1 Tax=Mycolicibacterium wolinskyi TaxID=59750 RepID=UPI0039179794
MSGNRTANGNLAVGPAGAGAIGLGVAANDAATGQLVRVARGGVVRVIAEAAITAGAAVQVGAAAGVVTATTGTVVGHAVTGAAAGGIAEIAWPA